MDLPAATFLQSTHSPLPSLSLIRLGCVQTDSYAGKDLMSSTMVYISNAISSKCKIPVVCPLYLCQIRADWVSISNRAIHMS
jgi:hypothetical protein